MPVLAKDSRKHTGGTGSSSSTISMCEMGDDVDSSLAVGRSAAPGRFREGQGRIRQQSTIVSGMNRTFQQNMIKLSTCLFMTP
jgi:hypothetical protein